MNVSYFFRKPKFPAIFDTGEELLGLRNWAECRRRIERLDFDDSRTRPLIDATAEGFDYHPKLQMITPVTLKKQWRKAEIIALYNLRKPASAPVYSKSIANRTVPTLLQEIVELLNTAKQHSRRSRESIA